MFDISLCVLGRREPCGGVHLQSARGGGHWHGKDVDHQAVRAQHLLDALQVDDRRGLCAEGDPVGRQHGGAAAALGHCRAGAVRQHDARILQGGRRRLCCF